MKVLALLLVWMVLLLGMNSCLLGQDQIFLLPNGYKGVVIVIYNQQNGQPPKYLQGKRVYEIPEDGVLKTQFAPNNSWRRPDKFFYLADGKMTEIPYVINTRELREDAVQTCCLSSGKTGKAVNDWSIEYDQFDVGTKSDIEKASEKANKIRIGDLIGPTK